MYGIPGQWYLYHSPAYAYVIIWTSILEMISYRERPLGKLGSFVDRSRPYDFFLFYFLRFFLITYLSGMYVDTV